MNLQSISRLSIISSVDLAHAIENYPWIEIRSSSNPLNPLKYPSFPEKCASLEGKRPKFTGFPSAPRARGGWQGIEGRGWRQLGWFYDEWNALPLAGPRPLAPFATRDVNFTVFMNIYINLHFTTASVATQQGGERAWLEKKEKRVHDGVENGEFYPRDDGGSEDEKLG